MARAGSARRRLPGQHVPWPYERLPAPGISFIDPAPTETPPAPQAHTKPPAKPGRTRARCRYWPWAELMRLTLGLPVDTLGPPALPLPHAASPRPSLTAGAA
jgi:hypothetical protein